MVLAAAVSIVAVLLPSSVRPGDVIRQLEIPGHGTLELAVPADWRFSIDPATEPPAMELSLPGGFGFVLTVTPQPPPDGSGERDARYYAARAVDRARREVAATSVEDPIAVEELRDRNTVFWFAATKKAPLRGEHPHVVTGAVAVGRMMVVFTLRHYVEELPERDLVLRAMAEARHVPPTTTEPFALALPLESWALLVDLHGFEVDGIRTWADGSGVTVTGTNRETGLAATIFLERVGGKPRAKDCFHAAFDRPMAAPLHRKDVKRTHREGMEIGEYLVPRFRGIEIHRKHVNAYLARGDVCAHIHLSKRGFAPRDQELFETVLRTVRFGNPPP